MIRKTTIARVFLRIVYGVIFVALLLVFNYFQNKALVSNPIYGLVAVVFLLVSIPFIILTIRKLKDDDKN